MNVQCVKCKYIKPGEKTPSGVSMCHDCMKAYKTFLHQKYVEFKKLIQDVDWWREE